MNRFDFHAAYLKRQRALEETLGTAGAFSKHGPTIGSASEHDWGKMLESFLPRRYGVGPIQAVDHHGNQSEAIDLAIYDRQYSPLWFEVPGSNTLIVPAESVYAVFEVKQSFKAENIRAAAQKVRSVRSLDRTSVSIRHAGGEYDPQDPADKHILGGILALRDGGRLKQIESVVGDGYLDLGVCIQGYAFDREPGEEVKLSDKGTELAFFSLHLFSRLQRHGSTLALDIEAYERSLRGN